MSELLRAVHLPDLIAAHWGHEAIRGLHQDRGGVICDRRPGQEETRPSFSVYKNAGVWRWKRHGGDGASGSAYGFLIELGYSEQQAREELHRLAGVPLEQGRVAPFTPHVTYQPPSALELAQRSLAHFAPLNPRELTLAAQLLAPLRAHDQATEDLQARGLHAWAGVKAYKLRQMFKTREGRILGQAGALAFVLTGPDGLARGLKIRNLGSKAELAAAGLERYVYRLAGHGAPAWCSPEYGQGEALLLVEGELNGAAAARVAKVLRLSVDVQGLAGAGGTPYLDGMVGRVVYLYADPDASGHACIERLGQVAHEAGATEVRALTSLPDGDFCDLLGRNGAGTFGEQLRDALKSSQLWQPATADISGRTAVPQIKTAARATAADLWQSGSPHRSWGGDDTLWSEAVSGWGLPGGGW